jgi:4-hydroxy-L-threonine phosphate dehydrogenase PdxA
MPLPRIAIATGDPAGIGPEIALKAALDSRVTAPCRPILVGDPAVVSMHAQAAGLAPKLNVIASAADAADNAVNLIDARNRRGWRTYRGRSRNCMEIFSAEDAEIRHANLRTIYGEYYRTGGRRDEETAAALVGP